MSSYSDFGPLDTFRGDSFSCETAFYEKRIKDLEKEVERLKGRDTEKDAKICEMIRTKIMDEKEPANINQLTSALANMATVINKAVIV